MKPAIFAVEESILSFLCVIGIQMTTVRTNNIHALFKTLDLKVPLNISRYPSFHNPSSLLFTSSQLTMFQKASTNLALSFL